MRKTVQITYILKKEFPNLHFSEKTVSLFEKYFEILEQWNKKINLTAIIDPEQMITKHLLDSLVVYNTSIGQSLMTLPSSSLLDLGSGAGIPGILLQISNPYLNVISIDKSQKKIGFQEYIKAKLELQNLELLSERVETLMTRRIYEKSLDFIVSRAFVQIKDLFEYGRFFLKEHGYLILWKGAGWQDELKATPDSLQIHFKLVESSTYQFKQTNFGGRILVFRHT